MFNKWQLMIAANYPVSFWNLIFESQSQTNSSQTSTIVLNRSFVLIWKYAASYLSLYPLQSSIILLCFDIFLLEGSSAQLLRPERQIRFILKGFWSFEPLFITSWIYLYLVYYYKDFLSLQSCLSFKIFACLF